MNADTKILPSSVLVIKPVKPERATVERMKNEILNRFGEKLKAEIELIRQVPSGNRTEA
ncbi:MAG TPA: hypothetical protein VMT64_04395 [Candidatus Binataceae bacterium]|nr:hypothetical protein [Candidatus Binataceae bacterium]